MHNGPVADPRRQQAAAAAAYDKTGRVVGPDATVAGGGGRVSDSSAGSGGVSHSVKTNISVNNSELSKPGSKAAASVNLKGSPKLGTKFNHPQQGPGGPLQNGDSVGVGRGGVRPNQRGGGRGQPRHVGGTPSPQRPSGGGGGAPTYQRPPGIQTLQVPGGLQGGRPALAHAARRGNNVAASKRTRFALQVTQWCIRAIRPKKVRSFIEDYKTSLVNHIYI